MIPKSAKDILHGRLGRRRKPPGAAPGTLNVDPDALPPRVTITAFGPDGVEERTVTDLAEVAAVRAARPVVWVNVDGLGHEETLREIGDLFDIHRLALEDVTNVRQRAKVESYEDHLFVVTRMIRAERRVETEQVTLFLGDGYVLTFQERVGDCFDLVRQRIRSGKGRIRGAGADYLAYALLDAVVDRYFPVLETLGERIEQLENEVLDSPDPPLVARIHAMRRELLTVRRAIWPHREAINQLVRDDTDRITAETGVYLRDVYDHVVSLVDMVETYRELASGLLDVYLSSVSNRMNEIMKVLTIFAAIFIPLGFIAGLYGMNFDPDSPWNMPELRMRYGYPFALLLMASVAIGLLGFFRWKGWLGGRATTRIDPEDAPSGGAPDEPSRGGGRA